MKIVIVGARRRNEAGDDGLVNMLVDDLISRYPQLMVLSSSCDRGIGKIIKNKCLPLGQKNAKAIFRFTEVAIRVYLRQGEELTKAEFASLFSARNAYFIEVGDEFHMFLDGNEPRGMMSDLYQRIRQRGAPYAMYRPGERDIKKPTPKGGLFIVSGGHANDVVN